jgi:hypothetical protein
MLVLAGFSFFYTFMRKYAYSAISHTFLITVLAAQWYVALSLALSPRLVCVHANTCIA